MKADAARHTVTTEAWYSRNGHCALTPHLEEPLGEVPLEGAPQQRVAGAPDQVQEVRVAPRQAAVLLRRKIATPCSLCVTFPRTSCQAPNHQLLLLLQRCLSRAAAHQRQPCICTPHRCCQLRHPQGGCLGDGCSVQQKRLQRFQCLPSVAATWLQPRTTVARAQRPLQLRQAEAQEMKSRQPGIGPMPLHAHW